MRNLIKMSCKDTLWNRYFGMSKVLAESQKVIKNIIICLLGIMVSRVNFRPRTHFREYCPMWKGNVIKWMDGWCFGARGKVRRSPKQGFLLWETYKTYGKFQAIKFCHEPNQSRENSNQSMVLEETSGESGDNELFITNFMLIFKHWIDELTGQHHVLRLSY